MDCNSFRRSVAEPAESNITSELGCDRLAIKMISLHFNLIVVKLLGFISLFVSRNCQSRLLVELDRTEVTSSIDVVITIPH